MLLGTTEIKTVFSKLSIRLAFPKFNQISTATSKDKTKSIRRFFVSKIVSSSGYLFIL